MSEKSCFRGPFDKQHGKEVQTMLKCERHQFYHNYWSLWRQLRLKKFLLVTWKVLRLIANILTANDKCFLLNRDNLKQLIQMHLSEKQKTFSEFFSAILKSRLNFEHFPKKKTIIADVFRKSQTRKTWLNKSLKSPVSEDHSTSNMVRRTKHCWDLNHTTLIIFIDHSEDNWIGKSVS